MGVCRNEWETLKYNIVTGAASATNIALTGIVATDKIVAVLNLTDLVDVSLAGLVITAGNFQVTASTSTKKLLVIWCDRNAG